MCIRDRLNYAVYSLFGKWGNVILGIAMILACMTTSIGLTTAFGDYFTKLFPKPVSYTHLR